MTQSIYRFGKGYKVGVSAVDSVVEALLGGKGAKLAEMGALGLPVPPGVTITTEVCNSYLTQGIDIDNLVNDVLNHFEDIAHDFGYMPLVSVRSGARVSMPGMMDTILNVGICDENFDEWAERLGENAAHDCYARLVEMYSDVVVGIPKEAFDDCSDTSEMLEVYTTLTGETFPQAIEEQLAGAIEAVFNSWNSDRALAYRAINNIPNDWGTAVNVQTMVFGNKNDQSATGVLFTRDFNTGIDQAVIDWLPNAQGEDVVAGTHTPKSGADLYTWNSDVAQDLVGLAKNLEYHYNDMQDIEFTIEDGKLWILQTRTGKRSARAAFQIAYDFYKAGKIDKAECIKRITAKQYSALQRPAIDPEFNRKPCVTGIPASGSIVTGVAVLSAEAAIACKEDCILVTDETTPDDFAGMAASVGILTRNGGITSHAAVVARGMDKTCVVGAEDLKFEGLEGKQITMDGATGRIWIDKDVPVVAGEVPDCAKEIIGWATEEDDTFLLIGPESVSKGDTAYVDVSGSLTNTKTLSEALSGLKGASGVLSFGNNQRNPASDIEFLSFFGIDPTVTSGDVYEVIAKVLKQKKWTKSFKNKWTLHLPNDVEPAFAEEMRKHGWRVVQRINSFKAALCADGYVVIEDAFLDQLTREKIEFAELENLITAAGREVKELPVPVSQKRRLFDVLGA